MHDLFIQKSQWDQQQSRLRELGSHQNQFLNLINKSNSIPDIINVEKNIDENHGGLSVDFFRRWRYECLQDVQEVALLEPTAPVSMVLSEVKLDDVKPSTSGHSKSIRPLRIDDYDEYYLFECRVLFYMLIFLIFIFFLENNLNNLQHLVIQSRLGHYELTIMMNITCLNVGYVLTINIFFEIFFNFIHFLNNMDFSKTHVKNLKNVCMHIFLSFF